jgi:hypothetical protein
MQNSSTLNSQRDKKSIGSNASGEKIRSNTVLKERHQGERILNLFQTPNIKNN